MHDNSLLFPRVLLTFQYFTFLQYCHGNENVRLLHSNCKTQKRFKQASHVPSGILSPGANRMSLTNAFYFIFCGGWWLNVRLPYNLYSMRILSHFIYILFGRGRWNVLLAIGVRVPCVYCGVTVCLIYMLILRARVTQ